MNTQTPIKTAVQIVGGFEKLAKALTATNPKGLTKAAVWQWTLPGRNVPAAHCPDIERITNGAVSCEQLRPDVNWAYLRGRKPRKSTK